MCSASPLRKFGVPFQARIYYAHDLDPTTEEDAPPDARRISSPQNPPTLSPATAWQWSAPTPATLPRPTNTLKRSWLRIPNTSPAYFQYGQFLAEVRPHGGGAIHLSAGIATAQRTGDEHARSEMEAALAELGLSGTGTLACRGFCHRDRNSRPKLSATKPHRQECLCYAKPPR